MPEFKVKYLEIDKIQRLKKKTQVKGKRQKTKYMYKCQRQKTETNDKRLRQKEKTKDKGPNESLLKTHSHC